MKKLFFMTVLLAGCFGVMHADDVEEQTKDRAPVGERELSESDLLDFYESRLVEACEYELQEQDLEEENLIKIVPDVQMMTASQTARNEFVRQGFKQSSAVAAPATSWTTHPGVFHNAYKINFNHPDITKVNTIELEDGSRWKMYSQDTYKVENWLTMTNSFTADALIIEPNKNWPTYSKHRFYLTNQQTKVGVRVNLTMSPIYNSPYTRFIYSYTLIYDNLGGLHVQLCLNDGSIWNMLPTDYPITSRWQANEIVILGVNTGVYSSLAPNMLINVHTNDWAVGTCIAR